MRKVLHGVLALTTVASGAPALAEPTDAAADQRTTVGAADLNPLRNVEVVVVTAQKRTERLIDVPVPVTAINAGALAERNQVRLQDYYTSIPGLNLTTGTGAQDAPVLSIRGVTTGGVGFGANPTVGVVVDDVPYGSSTGLGGGNLVPDIDPSDLARVEVLRGPQGTLYGASSLGGLLKFVTVDPSTEAFSGRVQGGLSNVKHGDGMGHNVRAAMNVPITGNLAVRVSGFTRRDPGYIDDPGLGADGVNQRDSHGGRVTALLTTDADFTLKVSALMHHSETDGSSSAHVLPGLGELDQTYVLPNLGGYERDSEVYSAVITKAFGAAELTSISGYALNDVTGSIDRTAAFGALANQVYGVNGARFLESFRTEKFSQELRLRLPLGQRVQWLLGAYYTDETSEFTQDVEAVDPDSGRTVALPYHNPFDSQYEELAFFTDFTFKVTDRFDVQVGGRQGRNEQSLSAVFEGEFIPFFFGLPSPYVYPGEESDDSSFTYLVTPRYKMTQDAMLYARFASGYRPGGPNSNAEALGVPSTFAPDTTRNYEVGFKGELLDGLLAFDASVFYIDWREIQLQLSDPITTFVYFANAGDAESQGLELSAQAKPVDGLSITGWVSWNQAELKDSLPGSSTARAAAGARLPHSSRFSGNLAIDQHFPLASMDGYVGASFSYVGDRLGDFTATGERQEFASYSQIDLRAGVSLESWAVDLFVNNVADKRGVLSGGLGTAMPFAFQYIQPRTVGVSLTKEF